MENARDENYCRRREDTDFSTPSVNDMAGEEATHNTAKISRGSQKAFDVCINPELLLERTLSKAKMVNLRPSKVTWISYQNIQRRHH